MTRTDISCRLCLGLVAILVCQGVRAEAPPPASVSITLPADPIRFAPGPGSEIASGYCLICHSAEYVHMQPTQDRTRWRKIVHKMKRTFGCPIPDDKIEPLVDYLVSEGSRPSLPTADEAGSREGVPESHGDPARGQVVYEAHCLTCHGASGKGDSPIGRALIPPAADLTAPKVRSAADDQLLNAIRNGKPPTAMPPWEHSLSPQAILDVLAYVRSFSR